MTDTLPSRQFLVQQACLNAAMKEEPRLPATMVKHYLKGRFGRAAFGGEQGGLNNIVAMIREEYRALLSRYGSAT